MGRRRSRCSQASRFSSTSLIMSVAIGPGCTELQRLLSRACWMAVDLVQSRTALLVAVYAAVSPGLPTRPAVDEILMMEPPPAARIAGLAHFVPRNTPLTLTAMMRSHSVSLVSSIRAWNRIPALLTKTLSLPYVWTAVATAARQSISWVTFRWAYVAWPPAARMWASTCLPPSFLPARPAADQRDLSCEPAHGALLSAARP